MKPCRVQPGDPARPAQQSARRCAESARGDEVEGCLFCARPWQHGRRQLQCGPAANFACRRIPWHAATAAAARALGDAGAAPIIRSSVGCAPRGNVRLPHRRRGRTCLRVRTTRHFGQATFFFATAGRAARAEATAARNFATAAAAAGAARSAASSARR